MGFYRGGGSPLGRLVGGGIGALVSLALFGYGVWSWHRCRAAESWPTVVGKVDSSSVTSTHSRKGGTKYRCNVAYHFSVAGRDFTGDNIEPSGNPSGSSSAANTLKSRYPAGAVCTVHYDPDDPSANCLELGGEGGAWIFIGLGGVMALVSAFSIARSFLPMGRI